MTLDALAFETHFLAHLAPVWRALPESLRGRFIVDRSLMEQAQRAGIEAEPIDAQAVRESMPLQPPVFDGKPALVASIGDIKVGRRLGYGPFAFLEHGAGQTYDSPSAVMSSYAGGPDRADNELFMVPNEYAASRWRLAYPNARVEVVGSPRLADLPSRVPDGMTTVAISFHGRWPNVPYGGTAAPEYVNRLRSLAERFHVIGHAHPGNGWQDQMARDYARAGIEFVRDFDEVCRRADVYVCDNSSTIFEFASTGRPVVLMNSEYWHRQGGPGGRFWDWAGVGPNVWPRDDLGEAIARALALLPHDVAAREAALDLVYVYREDATERAVRAVLDWMASKVGVAA